MTKLFKARLTWMNDVPLYAGRHYLFHGKFGRILVEVTRIRNRIDPDGFQRLACDKLVKNEIGEVDLAFPESLQIDVYEQNRAIGGFVLIDRQANFTVANGMILFPLRRSANIYRYSSAERAVERAVSMSQSPRVIWLTGLSGSGKSTIANALEQRLADQGRHTMLLDGDNVRHGLNKDLGFTEADRVENIRRIGEVAKLMVEAGLIVITAFISPYKSERETVRTLLPKGQFIEVHLSTSLEVCEQRDPKGLYRKARNGELPNFTGINAPYEEPELPELRLDTFTATIEECVAAICRLITLI